jgi:K+-sensing histidine kinase KdpD
LPGERAAHLWCFYRAGTRSSSSGSGLGLAIAAEIASAHGGTAQAAPVSPRGLRVALTLPARPDRRSAPKLAASPALRVSAE